MVEKKPIEAKDTVMTPMAVLQSIIEHSFKLKKAVQKGSHEEHDAIKEAQARISFKAGIEKERERINCLSFQEKIRKEIYKIVDVPVGQGDKHHMDEHSVSYITLSILSYLRQTFGGGKDV